jgi:hypothetical protein
VDILVNSGAHQNSVKCIEDIGGEEWDIAPYEHLFHVLLTKGAIRILRVGLRNFGRYPGELRSSRPDLNALDPSHDAAREGNALRRTNADKAAGPVM